MDVNIINERVDKALADNRRAEHIVIGMALAIFALGLTIAGAGYWARSPYVSGGAMLFQGCLYWPIREILKLRRDNLVLQTVPAIVSVLPAGEAAAEIVKTLAFLRR